MNGITTGLLLPFLGTTLGAACVFLMKEAMAAQLQKILTGFAAGVMVEASVWSLLIPSIEMTGKEGFMSILPAIAGFLAGILFLLFLMCSSVNALLKSTPRTVGAALKLL